MSGRDIIFDQNYRHNLKIRRTLETINANYDGNRDSKEFKEFMTYLKRFWFSGGIHHHYSSAKLQPGFSSEFLNNLISNTNSSDDYPFPLENGETKSELFQFVSNIIFDDKTDLKRVNRDEGVDIILESANNYYGPNVSELDVSLFYQKNLKKELLNMD